MKGKKIIATFIGSLVIVALCVSSASAFIDCSEATIVQSGVYPDGEGSAPGRSPYIVRLDCNDDTKWEGDVQFYLNSDLGDSGFATVLSAQALDKPLWVRVSNRTPGSLVEIMYINTPTP